MKRLTFLTLCLFAFGACSTSEKENPTKELSHKFDDSQLVEIYEAKDHRNADFLIKELENPNEHYREAAAMALASCIDSISIDPLCHALTDSSKSVVFAAAYALGQIAHQESTLSLLECVQKHSGDSESGIVWEAIGSCADSTQAAFVRDAIGLESDTRGVSKFLYRLAIRQMLDASYEELVKKQLSSDDENDILLALHSVLRNRNPVFQNLSKTIIALNNHKDLAIRIAANGSLARIPNTESRRHLEQVLANTNEDINVLVSSIRAYGQQDSLKQDLAGDLVQHPNREVALTACNLLPKISEEIDWIVSDLATPEDLIVEAAILKHIPEFVYANSDTLWNKMMSLDDPYTKAAWMAPLAADASRMSSFTDMMCDTACHRIISTTACESVLVIREAGDWEGDFDQILQKGFLSGDVTVMALLAMHMRQFPDDFADTDLTMLEDARDKLTLPIDIETFYEIEHTLSILNDSVWEKPLPEWNHPIDWDLVKSIPSHAKAEVLTTAGTFVIDLDIENAPASVSNFVQLVEDGHFTGKSFHRVVPNFVIQTGCPRGDGFGSVPYSIRSEFDLHNYSAGAVGMASAGNDTESCQWFVTHSPTPHLEGRYSIFGYVSEGMDVVNNTHQGDDLIDIKIIK